jgi:ribonuclease P protein component
MRQNLTTLKKRSDFVRIARQGKKWVSASLIVQALQRPINHFEEAVCDANSLPLIRVGFTASKKVGNAVARNRAKRRLRALVKECINKAPGCDLDYVLIARKSVLETDFQTLRRELNFALWKLPELLARKDRG